MELLSDVTRRDLRKGEDNPWQEESIRLSLNGISLSLFKLSYTCTQATISKQECLDLAKRLSQETSQRSMAEVKLGSLQIDLKHALTRAQSAEQSVASLQKQLAVRGIPSGLCLSLFRPRFPCFHE